MIRNVSLEEISDGKLYGLNDMVKADCGDCKGCSACCHGMGTSIILDPFDVYQLTTYLNQTFETLLGDMVELNVVDGVVLPNLRMKGDKEACGFLDENKRCRIHSFRPGICRLFPLGRFYNKDSFQYFLQAHECHKQNRTKIKVKKWIDTPQLEANQHFVLNWHLFQKDIQTCIQSRTQGEKAKEINMYLLTQFYLTPFDSDQDVYDEIQLRMGEARKRLDIFP